jgi:gas vesicle protein
MKTHTNEFENEVEAMQHRTRPVKPVLGGFLVGSLIGVATALLFAPRSGEETRAEIRGRAVDLRDRTTDTVRDSVSQARSRAYELKDTVVEKAEGLKDRGKQTLSRKLDDASQAIDNGKQKVQES